MKVTKINVQNCKLSIVCAAESIAEDSDVNVESIGHG